MAVQTVDLETSGMHCQSCAMLIEMSVKELDGVEDARVDLAGSVTHVTFDADKVGVDAIVQEIVKAGYGASQAG
jgi:copper chaperone CopZ